jgi:RNAse (barnase) inhibitor barstar
MDKLIAGVLLSENISDKEYYIAVIDGTACRTMKSFLKEIARSFKFPSYYGQNMNALNDCINDLEWIDKPNYILVIKNSKDFLSKEPKEEPTHV